MDGGTGVEKESGEKDGEKRGGGPRECTKTKTRQGVKWENKSGEWGGERTSFADD